MNRSSLLPAYYQPEPEAPNLMHIAMTGWVIGFSLGAILAYSWRWWMILQA